MQTVMSFGGGVQSWGLAALVATGEFEPPDYAVMVDTGRECRSTWEYLAEHGDRLPFKLEIVHIPLPDIFYKNGNHDCLLPAYFVGGKLPTFCSGKWKRDQFRRYLRARGVKKARVIFGISYDEADRMRTSGLRWLENVYPLCDNRITRADCIKAAADYFGETPPRSRCWMCPNQHRADWLSMPEDELQMAEEIDNQIRAYGLYLSRFCVPLRESILMDSAQMDMFSECDGGYCFV